MNAYFFRTVQSADPRYGNMDRVCEEMNENGVCIRYSALETAEVEVQIDDNDVAGLVLPPPL